MLVLCEHILFATDNTRDCFLNLRQIDVPAVSEHILFGTDITGDC